MFLLASLSSLCNLLCPFFLWGSSRSSSHCGFWALRISSTLVFQNTDLSEPVFMVMALNPPSHLLLALHLSPQSHWARTAAFLCFSSDTVLGFTTISTYFSIRVAMACTSSFLFTVVTHSEFQTHCFIVSLQMLMRELSFRKAERITCRTFSFSSSSPPAEHLECRLHKWLGLYPEPPTVCQTTI